MTPEGLIKKTIAGILDKSKLIFGVQIFFWYNPSTGIFDPKTRRFRKNTSKHSIKGVSDILGITEKGTFIAIEVKAGKNKTTEDQDKFLAKIKSLNGISIVIYSPNEFVDKMKEQLKITRNIV